MAWSTILNYKYFKSYNIPYSHIPINYMKSQLLMDTNCCSGNNNLCPLAQYVLIWYIPEIYSCNITSPHSYFVLQWTTLMILHYKANRISAFNFIYIKACDKLLPKQCHGISHRRLVCVRYRTSSSTGSVVELQLKLNACWHGCCVVFHSIWIDQSK